jgi:hypothetical protein
VPKASLVWNEERGGVPHSGFSAELGNITYHVASRDYGYPAYVEARGARGVLKRLDLGYYAKIEQAKQACERHYQAGCDLSKAERVDEKPGPSN